jgi:hypothetical protein
MTTVTYQATIRNFRRIDEADITIGPEPVTVLIARNSEGKTSALRAVGAALTRDPGVYGVTKKSAGAVLHDRSVFDETAADARRASFAGVVVERYEGDEHTGAVKITWPGQDVTERGRAPARASRVAAGLDNPLEGKPADWLNFLTDILPEAQPDQAAIGDALTSAGIAPLEASDIAEALVSGHQTFEQAEAEMVERSRAAQRMWRQITGQSYGDTVGASWRPPSWSRDLEGVTAAALAEQIKAARGRLVVAAKRGVAAEASQLAEEGARLSRCLQDARSAAEAAYMKPRREALQHAERELAALKSLSEVGPQRLLYCAHCGAANAFVLGEDGKPALHEPMSEAELETARRNQAEAIKAAEEKVAAAARAAADAVANGDSRPPSREEEALTAQLAEVRQKLARLGSEVAETETPEMVAVRETIETLERQHQMVTDVERAAGHHQVAQASRAAVVQLRPGGLRRALLLKQIETVMTQWLEDYASALFDQDDGALTIDTESEGLELLAYGETYRQITWGGDPNSVALRMHYTVQLLAAIMDGSDIVLLDRADTLTNHRLIALAELVRGVGVPALIAATRSDPAEVAAGIARAMGARVIVMEDGRTVAVEGG